jgi:hypothetical protein
VVEITPAELKDARKACDEAEEKGRFTLAGTEICIVANRLLNWFPIWMRPGKKAFAERYFLWVKHVDTYISIKNKEAPHPSKWGDERIEVITDDLDLVDDKISKLLQFQGLMLAAVSFGVGSLRSNKQVSFDFIPSWFAGYFKYAVGGAFFFWFFATFLCLWGVRRVTWGDLWKYEEDPKEGEEKHRDILISEVIKRTAKFRLAVIFTVVNVLLLAIFLGMLIYHWGWAEKKPDPPAAYTGEITAVGPFAQGAGCGNEVSLQEQVRNAAEEIIKKSVKTVLIVGSADAVPVRASLPKLYGNNIGLSLARARCVAGWLNQELAVRGVHVEIMFSVRDADGRTPYAREAGNPADRVVRITSLPDGAHP